MLTLSPLRQRAFSPLVHDPEQDDIFLQSPFNPPPPVHCLYPQCVHKQPVLINDDEGNNFLSPSSIATSPFFPAPTSQPLRTPQLNAQSQVASTSAVPGTGVGTKRKSSARSGGFSTPLRQTASTPLSISATNTDPASGVAFHCLAPLPAPRFSIHTPLTQSKAETEAHLKGQAETMKHLRIRDMENSDEDWGVIEDDNSAYEVEERNSIPTKKPLLNKLPLLLCRSKNQLCSPRKPLTIKAVPQKGSALDEVTEAISPGGHILERWARSRPRSLELLESVNQTLSPSASSHRATPQCPADALLVVVDHPTSCRQMHPMVHLTDLWRVSQAPVQLLCSLDHPYFNPPQRPVRIQHQILPHHQRDPTSMVSNRHSYAGSGAEAIATFPWCSSLNIPSPDSSPVSVPHSSHNDEDDMFFEPCGPLETSFMFSVMEGTPSPRSKGQKGKDMLPLKYKPCDSGVTLSDDEGDASNSLSAMPQASTSSSLNSDIGDDLITLGAIQGLDSGWPPAFVISGLDHNNRIDGVDVDTFILQMLAAGGKPSTKEPKKPPGTPVKKLKSTYLRGNRPPVAKCRGCQIWL
ncbi:hypothetical protein JVT61DRAFT_14213 [Boletus reticuloceps]|uniref:Uncharacterized protein n=1 Tax=Boletus reticuloceps TaxID=495285 RepID=A0A8I2YCZ5_9AGAM|nr:hypothetical protein JVT61DRAFT_14213 [Boletus reticuloceps]